MPSLDGLLIVVAVAFAAPFLLGLAPRPARSPPSCWRSSPASSSARRCSAGSRSTRRSRCWRRSASASCSSSAGSRSTSRACAAACCGSPPAATRSRSRSRVAVSLALGAGGLVQTPLLVAIALGSTSLGVLIPVLKDTGRIDSALGQLVIAGGSIADFAAIILLSLFFAGEGGPGATLVLIGALLGLALAVFARRARRAALDAHPRRPAAAAGHDGADPRARRVRPARRVRRRGAAARARGDPRHVRRRRDPLARRPRPGDDAPGLPAQARGDRLRRLHPDLLRHAAASASTSARSPAAPRRWRWCRCSCSRCCVVRGVPALLYRRLLDRRETLVAGLLQATSLPFLVAATAIGRELGLIGAGEGAALVGAGLLSVLAVPRRGRSRCCGAPPHHTEGNRHADHVLLLPHRRRGPRRRRATARRRACPATRISVLSGRMRRRPSRRARRRLRRQRAARSAPSPARRLDRRRDGQLRPGAGRAAPRRLRRRRPRRGHDATRRRPARPHRLAPRARAAARGGRARRRGGRGRRRRRCTTAACSCSSPPRERWTAAMARR